MMMARELEAYFGFKFQLKYLVTFVTWAGHLPSPNLSSLFYEKENNNSTFSVWLL